MGGKRPDQYRIAPGEGTRSDYKWTTDADPVDLKNQDAAKSRVRAKGRQNIPPKVPNPLGEEVRAAELERQERAHGGEEGTDALGAAELERQEHPQEEEEGPDD